MGYLAAVGLGAGDGPYGSLLGLGEDAARVHVGLLRAPSRQTHWARRTRWAHWTERAERATGTITATGRAGVVSERALTVSAQE